MPRFACCPSPRALSLLAVVLLVTTTGPASAQTRSAPAAHATSDARSRELESRVALLLGSTSGWMAAARLQEQAAAVRRDTAAAMAAFERAAWYYGGAELHGSARRMYERVASLAAARGDTARAAGALIDAAFAAVDDERRDIAARLVRRARPFLASPALTAAQRVALLERVDGPTLVALDELTRRD